MPRRSSGPALPDGEPRDLPTWMNVLVTEEMPIRWATEAGEPAPGDELAGRLVIGQEEQLVIDLCGAAATNLLAVLVQAHDDADVPLSPDLRRERQANAPGPDSGPYPGRPTDATPHA